MTLPVPDSQVPPAGAARSGASEPAGACETTSEASSDPACADRPQQEDSHDPQEDGASPGSRAAGLLGPTEVRGLSQALGIRPTKTLGQNFVHDAGTVRRIVRSAGVRPGDTVLEIGPGLGSLTLALLEAGARVAAVEIDPALARALPVTVADRMPEATGRLSVIEADALSITGPEALGGAGQPPPTRLVANLPYNVAVPVLLTVLEALPSLKTITVMVQAEVADRLAAAPGSRTYGVPSVKAAWYAAARRRRRRLRPTAQDPAQGLGQDGRGNRRRRVRPARRRHRPGAARRDPRHHRLRRPGRGAASHRCRWDRRADASRHLTGAAMTHLRAVPGGPTGPRDPSTPPRSGSASSVRVEAPGKVNLFLSAGAPGPDGYHPLTTVFQAVRLIETVTARRQSAQDHGTVTLTLEEPNDAVPTDASNLAVRAAELLAEATGVNEGVDLLLRKRVPVAGGMAGGSADAAATLVACNALWGTNLTLPELSALAARLGADVPFSLTGATAVGSGRGDLVTPIMTRGSYHWVFALADEGLSTPAVFQRFDELAGSGEPAVRDVPEALTAALRAGDARGLAGSLHNDLQAAALDLRPELAEVIAVAEEAGALRAIVSGSGPTIAALVEDPGSAQRVSRALKASGQVADVLRADAPVAGARVVG